MTTVSIITATHNAAAHLQHCLASLQQALRGQAPGGASPLVPPIEHIIIDGASSDGTVGIVEEYLKTGNQLLKTGDQLSVISDQSNNPGDQLSVISYQQPSGAVCTDNRSLITDHAFKFVSEPDRGLYDALNKGIRLATGDIIGLLHADDFYPSPDILAKVAAVFEDPAVDACYGDLLYVKNRDQLSVISDRLPSGEGITDHGSLITNHAFEIVRYWQSGPYSPEKFKWGWMPPHPTFFVRRAVYEKYGLFNCDLGTAADYELMLRFLLKQRIRCAYIPEVLMCMRVGGASNRTLKARLKANRMDRRAWTVNGLRPYPWTIAMKPLRKLSQWVKRPRLIHRD